MNEKISIYVCEILPVMPIMHCTGFCSYQFHDMYHLLIISIVYLVHKSLQTDIKTIKSLKKKEKTVISTNIKHQNTKIPTTTYIKILKLKLKMLANSNNNVNIIQNADINAKFTTTQKQHTFKG